MKVEVKSALEALAEKDSPCLGAVFCTYTLNITFLEEQILPELLDIRSDPQEHANRFLEEARVRLREIPLVCIADGSEYGGGHRLPYDLLLVNSRTFHPKLTLVLFETKARLMIGSGNFTEQGFGGNSEIFLCLELDYDDLNDRAILNNVDRFLETIHDLANDAGKQLPEFRATLKRLCPDVTDNELGEEIFFLHSESTEPLLETFLGLIPDEQTVTGIGILAPFYEEDRSEMETSVLMRLRDFARARSKKEFQFEVGLPWDEPLLGPKGDTAIQLDGNLGQLWGLREGEGNQTTISYLVPTRITSVKLFYEDQRGRNRSMDILDFENALYSSKAWPVGPIETYGPSKLLHEINESCPEASYWLFPDRRIEDGEVVHRPLHAKLYLVTTRYRQKNYTFVMIGSPNASRRALILSSPQSNVETALAVRLEGDYELSDLAPLLIKCPSEQIELADREFPTPRTNWARIINKATYNAREERLLVEWNHELKNTPFVLLYRDKLLHDGPMPEQNTSAWPDFELNPTSCELTIKVNDEDFYIPIHVEDIQNLPANPFLALLGLEELLAYFSGRMSLESISRLRERAAQGEAVDTGLSFVFGDRFQPVDAFKAWFGMKEELSDSMLTVGGFRVVLEGPVGVQVIWERMKEAVEKERIAQEEAWVYGLELFKILSSIQFEDSPSGKEKCKLLKNWIDSLDQDLKEMKPQVQKHHWVKKVAEFYGVQ